MQATSSTSSLIPPTVNTSSPPRHKKTSRNQTQSKIDRLVTKASKYFQQLESTGMLQVEDPDLEHSYVRHSCYKNCGVGRLFIWCKPAYPYIGEVGTIVLTCLEAILTKNTDPSWGLIGGIIGLNVVMGATSIGVHRYDYLKHKDEKQTKIKKEEERRKFIFSIFLAQFEQLNKTIGDLQTSLTTEIQNSHEESNKKIKKVEKKITLVEEKIKKVDQTIEDQATKCFKLIAQCFQHLKEKERLEKEEQQKQKAAQDQILEESLKNKELMFSHDKWISLILHLLKNDKNHHLSQLLEAAIQESVESPTDSPRTEESAHKKHKKSKKSTTSFTEEAGDMEEISETRPPLRSQPSTNCFNLFSSLERLGYRPRWILLETDQYLGADGVIYNTQEEAEDNNRRRTFDIERPLPGNLEADHVAIPMSS